jgi:propionate CoA-transferase
MNPALFGEPSMGLRERMLSIPLIERIDFDERANLLFINFEGLAVDTPQDIEEIESTVAAQVGATGRRVSVVVNYDHFSIRPELMDAYSAMVGRLTERYYDRVTRYAASGFLKARLEREAVAARRQAPGAGA